MALGAVREDEGGWPLDDVLLLLDGLSQRLSEGHLGKVLQCSVDSVPDGVIEYALHPAHQHLQAFDHGDHLEGHSFQWLKGDRGPSFTAWEVTHTSSLAPVLASARLPCPITFCPTAEDSVCSVPTWNWPHLIPPWVPWGQQYLIQERPVHQAYSWCIPMQKYTLKRQIWTWLRKEKEVTRVCILNPTCWITMGHELNTCGKGLELKQTNRQTKKRSQLLEFLTM